MEESSRQCQLVLKFRATADLPFAVTMGCTVVDIFSSVALLSSAFRALSVGVVNGNPFHTHALDVGFP